MRILRQTFLGIKSGGWSAWLPVPIVMFVEPMLAFRILDLCKEQGGGLENVNILLQQLLPILSIWWIFILLQDAVDGNGKEILSFYDPGRSRLLLLCVVAFTSFCILTMFSILLLGFYIRGLAWTFAELMMQSLCFSGIYLLLCALFHRTGVCLVVMMLYYIVTCFMNTSLLPFVRHLNIFDFMQAEDIQHFLSRTIYIGLVGLFAWIFSALLWKKEKM